MNPAVHYDMIVIGSGAAGHHGAIQAAKLGKRVAVVERSPFFGGAALQTGTIPSKTLRECVMRISKLGSRARYEPGELVRNAVKKTIDRVATNESSIFENQFRRNGVDVLLGRASFTDPFHLRVEGEQGEAIYKAERFLIATGTRPAHNPKIAMDGTSIFDTDSIRDLPSSRHTITIVGGGVIGVEYACMASALGAAVTLIERRPTILDFVDHEITEALSYHMRDQGVTFRLGEEVDRVERDASGEVCAVLKSGKQVWSEMLLYAVGREGNTDTLNLDACGLQVNERGRIPVNVYFQTPQPHIFAAGDVIGFPSLASVSMEQGRVAVCRAFGYEAKMAESFPYGIYTIPEISFAGKTEEQLTASAIPYEIGLARYREIARGQILDDTNGLLKLLFHRETRKLLGVHIVGEGATELIHIGQAVLAFEGSIEYFVHNIFNYPTLAECYKVAALNGMNRLGQLRPAVAAA